MSTEQVREHRGVSPRPGRARKALFGFVTVIVALAILEGGSRLFGHVEFPPDPLITEKKARWGERRLYDPFLFWRMRPLLRNEFGQITNSIGLRGPEISENGVDEFRVLSLGESTTYASRMRYEDCYSARVEAGLGTVDGKPVRVVNAGAPGYTIFQGRVFLERRGLELDPDVVLLYFGYNDFLGVAFRAERDYRAGQATAGFTDRQLHELRRRPVSRMADFLFARSNLVRWIAASVYRPAAANTGSTVDSAGDVGQDRYHPRVPEDDRWAALEQIRDLCSAHGIELVIVIPWYREFDAHVPLLRRFASESDLRVVDLPALLESIPNPIETYFDDEVHPNADGHGLIARAIVRELQDR